MSVSHYIGAFLGIAFIGLFIWGQVLAVRAQKLEQTRFLPTRDFSSAWDVLVVKGPHVGGHDVVQEIGHFESQQYRNPDDAIDELKFLVKEEGGNAVVNLRVRRETVTNLTNINHHYSVFRASGYGVVVKRRGQRRSSRREELAS